MTGMLRLVMLSLTAMRMIYLRLEMRITSELSMSRNGWTEKFQVCNNHTVIQQLKEVLYLKGRGGCVTWVKVKVIRTFDTPNYTKVYLSKPGLRETMFTN